MNHFLAKRLFRVFLSLVFTVGIGSLFFLSFNPSPQLAAAAPDAVPVIEFSKTAFSVNENAGTANLELKLSAVYTAAVTIHYKTLAGGTATPGSDYVAVTNNSIIIAAGNLTETIPINISDNNVYEPDETFLVQIFDPTNATLGNDLSATVTIKDNDPTPTPSPTSGTPTAYSDNYEPNNTLGDAYTIAAGASASCSATLWPAGDEDYFSFVGKKGSAYKIYTSNLVAGLDTEIFAYDTQGNQIAHNDDVQQGDRASLVQITANIDGFYYVRVINRDPSNPAGKTYCIKVEETNPPTATPSQTPVPGADECEFNSYRELACILEVGEDNAKTNMSFVPTLGSPQDTDYYKVWMRQGTYYTCETFVNDYADTNLIFLDQNGNDFQPNLGNNDKAPGDYGSKLSLLAPYTGWLYLLVGPVVAPPYEESFLHQYSVQCIAEVMTPTPTSTPTLTPAPFVGPPPASATPEATATSFVFPTFPATPTPIDLSILTPSPSPTPIVVNIQPLPTATPFGGGQQNISINITLYYDLNNNYLPELNEGVMDVAVALYDNTTGSLIAFGSTNEAGSVGFTSISAAGAVRVVVPFLNYSQVVIGGSSNILVRIAPQPLPIGIP